MLEVTYEYTILNVLEDHNTIEVRYTSPGRQTVTSIIRKPFETETLESVIALYAPLSIWDEPAFSKEPIEVGMVGSGVTNTFMATSKADFAITRRNTELYSSDWTQIPDAQLTPEKRAEWAVFRQALRDVPQQAGFPDNITWPTRPL